jgi:hypothetical protein
MRFVPAGGGVSLPSRAVPLGALRRLGARAEPPDR